MKHLYKLAFILVIGAAFALAQTGQGSQTMPSTPSSQPGAQQQDQSPVGQSSASADTKAVSDIQSALRKQLPASADNVTVSVGDDKKIQLSGSVSSDAEKQQVEQIAHSAAPNAEIVNKLNVSSSPSGPGSLPPSGSQPPAGGKPPLLRLVAYQQSGSQTTPSSKPPDTQTSPSGATSPAGSAPSSPSDQAGSMDKSQAQTGGNTGDVQDKIQKALQQDSSLSSANINVSINDNKVELSGTVASKDQKKTARQIAETNAGGMKVIDHLKVSGSENAPASPSTPPKN